MRKVDVATRLLQASTLGRLVHARSGDRPAGQRKKRKASALRTPHPLLDTTTCPCATQWASPGQQDRQPGTRGSTTVQSVLANQGIAEAQCGQKNSAVMRLIPVYHRQIAPMPLDGIVYQRTKGREPCKTFTKQAANISDASRSAGVVHQHKKLKKVRESCYIMPFSILFLNCVDVPCMEHPNQVHPHHTAERVELLSRPGPTLRRGSSHRTDVSAHRSSTQQKNGGREFRFRNEQSQENHMRHYIPASLA